MTSVYGLPLLLERLHWPVPRVRWETARALANLVRTGDLATRDAILDWNAQQYLEIDASFLPSIIETFSLTEHFQFEEVRRAITTPSILTDALLSRLYPEKARQLFSFRYDFTPELKVDSTARRLFSDGVGTLVPQIFQTVLRGEERTTGLPFMDQWRSEWATLRERHADPYTSYPHFFFAGDRGMSGSLDVRQRAVFVSAYLRTIHRAQLQWDMPPDYATYLASYALHLNGGLSEFDGSVRPSWSTGFRKELGGLGPTSLARSLWRKAAATVEPGFEPLAIDVVDHDEKLAVRVRVIRVIAPREATPTKSFAEPAWVRTKSDPWTLGGELLPGDYGHEEEGLQPLCVAAQTQAIGRIHIDLFLGRLLLADPILAHGVAEVFCEPDAILLNDNNGLLSRLALWYADWAPIHPPEIGLTGSLTTCRSDVIRALKLDCGVATPRMVEVTIAEREHGWEPSKVEKRSFRI